MLQTLLSWSTDNTIYFLRLFEVLLGKQSQESIGRRRQTDGESKGAQTAVAVEGGDTAIEKRAHFRESKALFGRGFVSCQSSRTK